MVDGTRGIQRSRQLDLLGYSKGAKLSDDGRYRWLLWRTWSES